MGVIGDGEIRIEEEQDLSSTNGIVVNKEKDEQGNESLQSVIEDGQLAIEEENDLSQTLHTENVNGKLQGNHKGLKKVNSNKKQIKYNERHSTWGIDNIPEELFEVNKDKSAKLTEFDVWKVEQSTKEVKINDKGNQKDDTNMVCDSWKVENNDEKDFLQSTNLQTDNDVKSMNSNATYSIDDNRNRTEENLSENVEKCERFKYENQSEANLTKCERFKYDNEDEANHETKCERFKCDNQIDSNPDNDEDPVTEAMDVEQNNKQENFFEMSKTIATDLIVTDQENKSTSRPIYMVPNTWNFEGFPNLENDEDRKIDKNMDTNVIENKENEVVFETNSEAKVAFDRNQCDTWNFEGIPNLEIEDKNIDENMDTNIIENIDNEVVFEQDNEEKIAFDRNQCNTWNFEEVPNLEIEDKNNEENMDTNVIENKENKVIFEKNNEDKVAFDRNHCDPWNFEGIPNLEIEEDRKTDENMDTNIIENKENKVVLENFEELVTNGDFEIVNKMHTNEMESSKDEKETGMIFDRNKCDV